MALGRLLVGCGSWLALDWLLGSWFALGCLRDRLLVVVLAVGWLLVGCLVGFLLAAGLLVGLWLVVAWSVLG